MLTYALGASEDAYRKAFIEHLEMRPASYLNLNAHGFAASEIDGRLMELYFDGEAGEGAAKGAAAGDIVGGIRRRRQVQEQQAKEQQWADQQASNYASRRNEYNCAYGACLEDKGYTVK